MREHSEQGFFFLPHVENKRAYIGFFDVVCYIFAVAIIFYGGEVGVLKAHIYCYCP